MPGSTRGADLTTAHRPLRVLVVHNAYASSTPSGENEAVHDELRMLAGAGLDVQTYVRSSDELSKLSARKAVEAGAGTVYARRAMRELATAIDSRRPDVLHLHNPYPLISPAVVRLARGRGVPVVQTVHNYRHTCMAGTFFRDGKLCRQCASPAGPAPGVVHACYRSSRLQSTAMAVGLIVHRGTWDQVDRFFAPSEFVAAELRRAGVDDTRITVRPGFVPDPGTSRRPGRGYLFVGRLSDEKGVRLLVDAWSAAHLPDDASLTIVGDGPLAAMVLELAQRDHRVVFRGSLAPAEVSLAYRAAAVVVTPSVCLETFGRAAVEAMAHGRPVIATELGALASAVDSQVGWSVRPTTEALANALAAASGDPTRTSDLGRAARQRFEDRYTEGRALAVSLRAYSELAAR